MNAPQVNAPKAPITAHPRRSVAVGSCLQAPVVLFDVEGTLVDAVPATLQCWRETLSEFGHDVAIKTLQRMSGLNGTDMLMHLLPGVTREEMRRLLDSQGQRYRSRYLPEIKPFPQAGHLFEALRRGGKAVGIATDCSRDELDHYLDVTGLRDLIDATACGDDVKQGKPHGDLLQSVLKKIRARGRDAVMIGDTPFDVLAARSVHAEAIGVLTGGFAPEDFAKVGARATVPDLEALKAGLANATRRAAPAAS
jgi:phosphoglycolate phosphatase-like HAD superfamily hydrolase